MKVLVGLLAAVALTLGLTSAPATAAPYPHSIATKCTSWNAGGATAKFRMTAGTAEPTATVTIRIYNGQGKLIKTARRKYKGGTAWWGFGQALPKGTYKAVFRTQTGKTSVFKNCSSKARLYKS